MAEEQISEAIQQEMQENVSGEVTIEMIKNFEVPASRGPSKLMNSF